MAQGQGAWSKVQNAWGTAHRAKREVNERKDCKSDCLPYALCATPFAENPLPHVLYQKPHAPCTMHCAQLCVVLYC